MFDVVQCQVRVYQIMERNGGVILETESMGRCRANRGFIAMGTPDLGMGVIFPSLPMMAVVRMSGRCGVHITSEVGAPAADSGRKFLGSELP